MSPPPGGATRAPPLGSKYYSRKWLRGSKLEHRDLQSQVRSAINHHSCGEHAWVRAGLSIPRRMSHALCRDGDTKLCCEIAHARFDSHKPGRHWSQRFSGRKRSITPSRSQRLVLKHLYATEFQPARPRTLHISNQPHISATAQVLSNDKVL